MPKKRYESDLQAECVKWFRLAYPKIAECLFAIGNGIPRDARQGAKRKREGAVPGVADLFLMVPTETNHGLFIEMKLPGRRHSDEQKEFCERATGLGYHYAMCRSFDDFEREVKSHLLGVR